MLEDISSYMRDFNAIRIARAAQKDAQLKKAEDDKQKGEEMRRAAMEGVSASQLIVYSYMCTC